VVAELVTDLARRIVRRGRHELGRAAEVSRATLAQRQRQADLDAFWQRLGRTSYRLVEAGEIDHPALRKAMERIDELQAEIAAADDVAPNGLPPQSPPIT
jgi:hypothetical protein